MIPDKRPFLPGDFSQQNFTIWDFPKSRPVFTDYFAIGN
jgi:hypothetical protein